LFLTKTKSLKFILTTHFTKLCKLLDEDKNIVNNHMKTDIIDLIPYYRYKMINGISTIKGGLCVLEQLNYPREILNNANNILKQM
jgi:DNA phosphorothioation-dependent restriction protein DptG